MSLARPAAGGPPRRRIHIDTDPGLDDLLALAFALALPEAGVVGVTTVAGNASLEAVTENALRFLTLAGKDPLVGRGADGPLTLSRGHAEHVHGPDGRRRVALPPAGRGGVPPANVVLGRVLGERSAEALVALGPLTNVARLAVEDAALFEGVDVFWMGGTLGRGNATPLAEFNCWADPEALRVVLGRGARLRIIPLEVTREVAVRPGDLEARDLGESPRGRFLAELLRTLMEAEGELGGEVRATLHDPCAIAAALRPDLFRFSERALDVCVEEGAQRGRLVEAGDEGAGRALWADTVQARALVQLFCERLIDWANATEGERRS